jgi:glycogen debranching enzyme
VQREGGLEGLLEATIGGIRGQLNALCIIDVILNCTATDSSWLVECGNCVYNEKNTPVLKSAIELDEAVHQFSEQLAKGQLLNYKKGNRVENEEDLNEIMN